MFPFGVNLLWIALRDYRPGDLLTEHTHPDGVYHYVYAVKGSGWMKIGNAQHTITPGQLFLTPPGEVHSFYSDTNEPLLSIELKFQISDEELASQLPELPQAIMLQNTVLAKLIPVMWQERCEMQYGYNQILAAQTFEMLTRLLRIHNEANANQATPADLQAVLSFINGHLSHKITLDDLLTVAHLDKTYFSKRFKRYMGITPMAYIRKARIEKAKNLMVFSDMSITQISEALGFQSIHHFSKVFRNDTGINPREYKRSLSHTGKSQF